MEMEDLMDTADTTVATTVATTMRITTKQMKCFQCILLHCAQQCTHTRKIVDTAVEGNQSRLHQTVIHMVKSKVEIASFLESSKVQMNTPALKLSFFGYCH